MLSPRHYKLHKGCHLPLKLLVSLPFSCALLNQTHYWAEQSLRSSHMSIRGHHAHKNSLLHWVSRTDVRFLVLPMRSLPFNTLKRTENIHGNVYSSIFSQPVAHLKETYSLYLMYYQANNHLARYEAHPTFSKKMPLDTIK